MGRVLPRSPLVGVMARCLAGRASQGDCSSAVRRSAMLLRAVGMDPVANLRLAAYADP